MPWKALENDRGWRPYSFDLIGVTGKTFSVYFNVINDGIGGRTAMCVDDVHLWACTPGVTHHRCPWRAMAALSLPTRRHIRRPLSLPTHAWAHRHRRARGQVRSAVGTADVEGHVPSRNWRQPSRP